MVTVQEAEADLQSVVDRVLAGEEVIISRQGNPVARVSPVAAPTRRRVPGTAKGKVVIAPDFDAPLPEDVLKDFGR